MYSPSVSRRGNSVKCTTMEIHKDAGDSSRDLYGAMGVVFVLELWTVERVQVAEVHSC
jgi:hypothetical protein